MKKSFYLLIGGLFVFSNLNFCDSGDSEKYVIGCRGWGLFAEFLWGLNHLEYCLRTNKIPVMYWKTSPYYEKDGYNGGDDLWTYYFEPVSDLIYEPGDVIHNISSNDKFPSGKENFTAIYNWYTDIIKDPTYPRKELRVWIKKYLIDRFVKFKPSIATKIESFYKKNMAGKRVIGIHLRGNHIKNEVQYPPLQEIFDEANKYASPQTQFFVATDQIKLLNEAISNLKGPVIYYDCYRTDKASTAPFPSGHPFRIDYSKARLGEDVLIETFLLSQCDFMIHTISNVSLAATYFNPELHGVRLYYRNDSLMKFTF